MACFAPISGWRTPKGTVTANAREGYRDRHVSIPCGRCLGCRLTRADEWTTRILHEAHTTELDYYARTGLIDPKQGRAGGTVTPLQADGGGSGNRRGVPDPPERFLEGDQGPPDPQKKDRRTPGSAFITLTYNNTSVPSDFGLHVEAWQLFAKKLRNKLSTFRFFMIGEYGPENLRPHFHAIIFGQDFRHDRIPIGTNEFGDRLYLSPDLEQIWGQGHTRVGLLSPRSANYVARYCVPVRGDEDERYKRIKDGRTYYVRPEFATMNRRPGIGSRWLQLYASDVYPSDTLTRDRGRRVRVPRYYDDLHKAKHGESALEGVREARRQHALHHKDSPAQKAAREEYAKRNLKRRNDP